MLKENGVKDIVEEIVGVRPVYAFLLDDGGDSWDVAFDGDSIEEDELIDALEEEGVEYDNAEWSSLYDKGWEDDNDGEEELFITMHNLRNFA